MEPTVTTNSAPSAAVPPGSALVYMPFQPSGPKTYDRYKHRQSIGLGVTQVVIAILCFIFNSVCIGVTQPSTQGNSLGFVGHGYWCGILFLITGIFGIVAGRKKSACLIVTFLVLCIISATFTIALLVVGILGAVFTDTERCHSEYQYQYQYDYGYSYSGYYPSYQWVCHTVPNYKVIIAMESLLAIAALVEVVVAIWGSALGCGSGVCCCSSPPVGFMPTNGYYPATGQMMCISQTQGGPYVYAPQPISSYPHGLVPPPSYAQPAWASSGPGFGQAPPAYAVNQVQPLWMMQPATANPGQVATDAHSIHKVPA